MPYLLIRHKVMDFEQWKSAFDAHSLIRQANGSRGGQLFRNVADPHELVVLLEWHNLDQARRFVESEELREMMEQSGVRDRPALYFLKDGEPISEAM